jgi:hypothetical protein
LLVVSRFAALLNALLALKCGKKVSKHCQESNADGIKFVECFVRGRALRKFFFSARFMSKFGFARQKQKVQSKRVYAADNANDIPVQLPPSSLLAWNYSHDMKPFLPS